MSWGVVAAAALVAGTYLLAITNAAQREALLAASTVMYTLATLALLASVRLDRSDRRQERQEQLRDREQTRYSSFLGAWLELWHNHRRLESGFVVPLERTAFERLRAYAGEFTGDMAQAIQHADLQVAMWNASVDDPSAMLNEWRKTNRELLKEALAGAAEAVESQAPGGDEWVADYRAW